MLTVIPQTTFAQRFAVLDPTRALIGFTPMHDTQIVLTLLAHARSRRVLAIGTASGHLTANLSEWTSDDAVIYSLGDVRAYPAGTIIEQADEAPPRAAFAQHVDYFGKSAKVCCIVADSRYFDFQRLAPLDFVFIDSAHDCVTVVSDTQQSYRALAPGGWLVWHDANNATPWVEVPRALADYGLPETIYLVEGTDVEFLQKAPATNSTPCTGYRLRWEGMSPYCTRWPMRTGPSSNACNDAVTPCKSPKRTRSRIAIDGSPPLLGTSVSGATERSDAV